MLSNNKSDQSTTSPINNDYYAIATSIQNKVLQIMPGKVIFNASCISIIIINHLQYVWQHLQYLLNLWEYSLLNLLGIATFQYKAAPNLIPLPSTVTSHKNIHSELKLNILYTLKPLFTPFINTCNFQMKMATTVHYLTSCPGFINTFIWFMVATVAYSVVSPKDHQLIGGCSIG